MKVVLDSYDLLRTIGAHPETFVGVSDLVRKQASALLIAQLKHKALDLQRYRDVRSAIGAEAFELFMDTAEDKLLKAVAKKIDPHSRLSKGTEADELRRHLLRLAEGKVQPSPKATRPAREAKGAAKRRRSEPAISDTPGPHAIATKPPGRR